MMVMIRWWWWWWWWWSDDDGDDDEDEDEDDYDKDDDDDDDDDDNDDDNADWYNARSFRQLMILHCKLYHLWWLSLINHVLQNLHDYMNLHESHDYILMAEHERKQRENW